MLSTQKAWSVKVQTVLEQHNDLFCFSALRVVLKDSLKTGGKAAIQGIVIKDELFDRYKNNEDFIQNWLRSPQTSLYYSLQVMQNTQDKSDALAALDGNFGEMFGFDDIDTDDDIVNVFNDPAACVGCAE